MRQGLSPLARKLRTGLNPGTVADNPVLPARAANLGAIIGVDPDHIWAKFGALPIVDSVGGQDIVLQAGTPLFNQATTGLWNGTDHASVTALKLVTTADLVSLAAGVDLDPGADSFALLLVHRTPTAPPANRGIIGTRQPGDEKGWSLEMLVGTNRVYGQGDQGGSHTSVIVEGDMSAGSPVPWHYSLVVVNRDTETFNVHTDLGSKTQSIAGHTTYTGTYQLSLGAFTASLAIPDMEYAYMAYWRGAKAEGLGAAQGAAFWQSQLDNPA